jgi:hypothetical protein
MFNRLNYPTRTSWGSILLFALFVIFLAMSERSGAQRGPPPLPRRSVLGAGAAEADGGIRVTVCPTKWILR